jgi:hypothetical protein
VVKPRLLPGLFFVYFLYFTPPLLAVNLLSLGGPVLTRPDFFIPDFCGIGFLLWNHR